MQGEDEDETLSLKNHSSKTLLIFKYPGFCSLSSEDIKDFFSAMCSLLQPVYVTENNLLLLFQTRQISAFFIVYQNCMLLADVDIN